MDQQNDGKKDRGVGPRIDSRAVLFELKGINYHYPSGEQALTDIDLNICRGEKVALLGANGCGKSTLLKVLDGLIFPQQGSFRAFGSEISESSLAVEQLAFAFRQRVGFVFQNSDAQLFNANVWEEIAFGPVQMGVESEEIYRRVDGVIAMLGLKHLKDRAPFKLSGGEKKKVALASVLSINPEVLILDEPTNGLDPRTQSWLVELLQDLNRAGKTIIIATHDLEILEAIADRAVVFGEDHRLGANGSCQEVLDNRELLIAVNLVDRNFHSHTHGDGHQHFHDHL